MLRLTCRSKWKHLCLLVGDVVAGFSPRLHRGAEYLMLKTTKTIAALMLTATLGIAACSKASADADPKAIEQKYGLSGGYVGQIDTENGKVEATIIPTTLDDGRKVQLIIPHEKIGEHQVYMRDGITITPMELSDP